MRVSRKSILNTGTRTRFCETTGSPNTIIADICLLYCVREGKYTDPRSRNESLHIHPSALPFISSQKDVKPPWEIVHEYTRQRRDALHGNDAYSVREDENPTSWLNAWTISLYNTAATALDLANHKSDWVTSKSVNSHVRCQAFTYSYI